MVVMKTARLVLVLAILLVVRIGHGQGFQKERDRMVDVHLAGQGIKSAHVLDAMRRVERHRFVPKIMEPHAYKDTALPIGHGQTISQPYIVAFMTEALELKPTDRVLEIGTGSGYQAAILSLLCHEVFTIELIQSLGLHADSLLREMNYRNVKVRVGDGYAGWREAAPFDAIIVTCSPSHIPIPLQEQLREGGRMIIPVGDKRIQELVLLRKQNGKIRRQNRLPVLFVPMNDSTGRRY